LKSSTDHQLIRFINFCVTLFICIEKIHNKCSKYPPFALIQALAFLRTTALAFPLHSSHTKCISAYSSIEYFGTVNDCNLCKRPIKIRSSQSVDFDSSQFRIVTTQSFLNLNIFREQSNISAVPKQKRTILFSENGSIYPKTV
jgi:hypothetical protein